MSDILFRSSVQLHAPDGDGRTLTGIAMRWDQPSKVRDIIMGRLGPEYAEAFAPGSADATLRDGQTRPMFVRHDYLQDPIGMTTFRPSDAERALMFETPLARTARADECLELVKDGSMRSVSVGFLPVNTIQRTFPGYGSVKYRTGVSLKELSLAPTGFGAYPGAEVLGVRTVGDGDEDPGCLMQAVDAAIDQAQCCLDPSSDSYNPMQAAAVLQAAETTIDKLLDLFNLVDADDIDGDDEDASQRMLRLGITSVPAIRRRIAYVRAVAAEITAEPERTNLEELKQRYGNAARRPIPPLFLTRDGLDAPADGTPVDGSEGVDDGATGSNETKPAGKRKPGEKDPDITASMGETGIAPGVTSSGSDVAAAGETNPGGPVTSPRTAAQEFLRRDNSGNGGSGTTDGDGQTNGPNNGGDAANGDDTSAASVQAGRSSDGTHPDSFPNVSRKAPGKPKDAGVSEAAHAGMMASGYSHIGNGTYQKGGDFVKLKRVDPSEFLTRVEHNFMGTGGLPPLDPKSHNPDDARYPIKDAASLKDAEDALGRAKPGDRAEIIAHIKAAAKTLGLEKSLNPDIYGK